MVFGIASTVSGLQTYDSETCNVAMWLLMVSGHFHSTGYLGPVTESYAQLTLELSTFLLFCIALNLQYVIN